MWGEGVEFRSEGGIARGVVESATVVKDIGGEACPEFVIDRAAGVFACGLAEFVAEAFAGFVAAGEADDGESGGKVSIGGEVVEGGDEFASGQVAGGTENDKGAGFGHRAADEVGAQRVGVGFFGHGKVRG